MRLPDRPVWVETRDLLSRSGSTLIEHPARAAAALQLVRVMRERGKTAVGGAWDGNPANLARRLGFVQSGRLWVVTRD